MQNEQGHRWTVMFSLARVSLLIVALAAALGWAASFVGLHDYGVHQLYGFTDITAWFIPGAIDGAAFATSLMTYRANIKGRAAVRGRLLMWAFTAASGWINWIHQVSPEGRFVAAGLPVAAVAVFDIVLIELRADFEERHGRRAFRLRPGLLMLRYLVDRRGTSDAFRRQIEAIPVASLAGLGNDLLTDAARGGRIVPRQWLDLPQAKSTLPPARNESHMIDQPNPGMTVPGTWLALPQATPQPPRELAATAPVPGAVQVHHTAQIPDPAPIHSTAPIPDAAPIHDTASIPDRGAIHSTAVEQELDSAWTNSTERWQQWDAWLDAAEGTQRDDGDGVETFTGQVSEPRWDQQDAPQHPASDSETTTKLPVISNDQLADERAAARDLVRRNPDEWTGKSLGEKFGKSSSWGRTQIKFVRQELEQEAPQRPQLVGVDR